MENFLEFLGRMHPMLVHFPIALILTGGAIELLRGGKDKPSEAGVACLLLGSLSALVAVGAGWLHAEHVDVGAAMEDVLFRHRWVGVGVAGVSLITGLVAWRMRAAESSSLGVVLRMGILLSMSLVAYDGHLGGTLVYGEGYLMDVLTQPSEDEDSTPAPDTKDVPEDDPELVDLTQNDPPSDPGTGSLDAGTPDGVEVDPVPPTPPADVTDATGGSDATDVASTGGGDATKVSYTREVLPIFEARCYKCHGPTGKARGGLRMHDIAALYEGPEDLWLIHPGSAEKSVLYQLLILPADDLDIMPASGDPLTSEQIDIIKRWIDEGAEVDEAGSSPKSSSSGERVGRSDPESTTEIAASEVVEEEPEAPSSPAVATTPAVVSLDEAQRARRDETLQALRALGAHAARVAQDTDEVEVHFGLMGKRVTDETLASLKGLEPCLVSLDLSRSQLTNAGLGALAGFTHLRRLRLDQTAIGDAGVAELEPLKQLEVLNLFGTKVGDTGLASVAVLPRLERVFVWQSAVTEEGIRSLRESRPALQIVGGEELESSDDGEASEEESGEEE